MRIIDRFTSEHEVFLRQIAALEALLAGDVGDEALATVVGTLSKPLLNHAENEERALFPDLRHELGGEGGPIAVLIEEHHLLHGQLERIDGRPTRDQLVAVIRAFIELLREHIAKEEEVLFPMASRVIGEDRLREMDDEISILLAGAR